MTLSPRYVPLLFPASVILMMIVASLWPRDVNFGPVMILAGGLCISYSSWRFRNPEWWRDDFWARRDRVREWLRFTLLPRALRRRLGERRRERIDGVVGALWGLGGIAVGIAQLAGFL